MVTFIFNKYKEEVRNKELFGAYDPAKIENIGVCSFLCHPPRIKKYYEQMGQATKTQQGKSEKEQKASSDGESDWVVDDGPFLSDIKNRAGEHGAKKYAESKGWKQILSREGKSSDRGFDQVWEDSSGGIIHVIEAKGGNATLAKSYGYNQGTVRWVVAVVRHRWIPKIQMLVQKSGQ